MGRGHPRAREAGRRPGCRAAPGRCLLRGRGRPESRAAAEEEEKAEMSSRKPRLALPPGATDCHMHVYHAEAPPAPGGPALPGDFREDAYRAMQQRLGLARVIVVQPNAYQDDNRVALAAIKALGPGAKGVAVVKPGVADAEIERLVKGGIVRQRTFQLPLGSVGFG